MPLKRQEASPSFPRQETLEFLLGDRNKESKATRHIKHLGELTEAERAESNLVRLGKRRTAIPGDPFGVWCSWAGNVGHGEDERMVEVMTPLFEELIAANIRDSAEIESLQSLLQMIPSTAICDIPSFLSNSEGIQVLQDTPEEVVITFKTGSRSVRMIQCKEIDVTDEKSYDLSIRAKTSGGEAEAQIEEPPLTPELAQYVMAQLWTKCLSCPTSTDFGYLEGWIDEDTTSKKGLKTDEVLMQLRMSAQEEYWLHMSAEQREVTRQDSIKEPSDPLLRSRLGVVKQNWVDLWKSQKRYPDFFRAYLRDQRAAENVWQYVEEDVLVVVDKNQQVVFANIENLSQLLFGEHTTRVLERCFDMWSFCTPLPFPESTRHVVDRYIRKIHPELDPSKATVETLQNAKMAVAHYGCWAAQGDPHGRYIVQTRDHSLPRKNDYAHLLLPHFCRAALPKAAEMIRFLVKPLDAAYYKDCVDILSNIDEGARLPSDDPEAFISLFAFGVNGYTQRHKDKNDVAGGLAGLCTFGSYTGGNLCIPQLNLKVPYQPGACALIRGTGLDHLVADYTGPRYFLIGTNHESVKRNAWRKLGRLPPLQPKRKRGETDLSNSGEDSEEDVMGTTCINMGDDDDDDIHYTNRELHGAGALNDSSPSEYASSAEPESTSGNDVPR